ncbi:MAG: hypothetical protein WD825_08260 [Gemmatimonadaceae bacterium]
MASTWRVRRGELGKARTIFERLREVGGAQIPLGSRDLRPFEIILCHREGALDPARLDYEELEARDDPGRDGSVHHAFALALFLANVARGERSKAGERMREYVFGTRRKRFPIWPYYRGSVSDPELAEELRRIVEPAEVPQIVLCAL